MKIKNIAVGDFVKVKKSLCHSEFKAKQVCEVIDIDHTDNHGFDVLIQGKNCLDWVNHKHLKKLEPQLKQIDHSVFNELDERWKFVARCLSGKAIATKSVPKIVPDGYYCEDGYLLIGEGYDTSNWQDSLIERDIAKELLEVDLSSELTGGELCKAMLDRGDTRIMCKVYDIDIQNDITHVIRAYREGKFHTKANRWTYAVPINNQGEPLTASEAGF